MTEVVRVFTFHAEGLERDDVWRRTSDLLEAVEARGGNATLFVDPSAAIDAGLDLGPRLGELLGRGHEVSQRSDLQETPGTTRDPRGRLDRDLACLREAGAAPRGFVARGWILPQEALEWLRKNGFRYDSTARTSDGWTAPTLADGVLRLPTTTSLERIAQHRGTPLPTPEGLAYELGYLRDADLVAFAHRMAAGTSLRRWGDAGPLITAAALADRIMAGPED